MSVFTYIPEFGAEKSVKPRVNNINFGDGYEQRVAVGINHVAETWRLQFNNRTLAEADDIENFLNDKGGVESFEWTPPNSTVEKKFKCQTWTRTINKANLYTISAVFEQVFGP